jgi:hypothetical protein
VFDLGNACRITPLLNVNLKLSGRFFFLMDVFVTLIGDIHYV